jgi:hypothetical protein
MRFKSLSLFALLLAVLMVAGPALAQRGDDSDRVSKNGAASGTIDGVDVSLEYGRPNVKGRDIWGGLVPYGEVWRTGANEATTITFSSPVMIEGEALPAGTYALFTIPGEDEWTVIFNETVEQWGAYDYDAEYDALRVTVTPRAHEMTEAMDFRVGDGEVVLMWDELAVPIAVEAGS